MIKIIFLFIISTKLLFALDYKNITVPLIKKFQEHYPSLTIIDIKIEPIGSFTNDLKNYKIKAIYISKASLKKSKGTFSVLYTNSIKEKKRFFKYFLDAKLGLYKAAHDINKGTELDVSDVVYEDISFDKVRFIPITKKYLDGYSTKHPIKEGEIIYTKDLKIIPDIKRGQVVEATLISNGIIVNFNATAMQDGVLGDIIRVKKANNKSFKAKVTSSSSVDILE